MSHTPISVFIITLNEEAHIEEVLQSVQHFDEVVLVDSGSTDKTLEIAARYAVKIHHQDWLGFAKQKAHAMSLCSNEWVFNIDADEVISPEHSALIQQRVDARSADAYRIYFEDLFWGKEMSPSSGKRSIVRVYHKNKVAFPTDRLVHENVVLEKGAKTESLLGLVKHYGYHSTDVLMAKQNKYSTLKAQEKFNKGKQPSYLKLLLIFPVMFIKAYFLKKMFLSGKRGLVHATIDAMYGFLKEAKLHELHYLKNNREDSVKNNHKESLSDSHKDSVNHSQKSSRKTSDNEHD